MRSLIAAAAIGLAGLTGHARAEFCVTLKELAAKPASYRDMTITVRNLVCADVKGGFRCAGRSQARLITINAWGLGPETSDEVAWRLVRRCKGESALADLACAATAIFEVRDQSDRLPAEFRPQNNALEITAPQIEILEPTAKFECVNRH